MKSGFLLEFTDWLKRLWAYIFGLLSAIVFIYQFIQMWRGDSWIVTIIIAAILYIILIICLAYIGFSKKTKAFQMGFPTSQQPPSKNREPRFPRIYKYACYGLVSVLLAIPVLIFIYYQKDVERQKKTIVLVADFFTQDATKHPITEQIIRELKDSMRNYADTEIESLGKEIKEQDESKARELGERYRADLVLWGWYQTYKNDVRLVIHVENLDKTGHLPIPTTGSYDVRADLMRMKVFDFQINVSKEMSALVLFTSGIIRYSAKDYKGAIERLSEAVNINKWPEDLLPRFDLLSFLGDAYLEDQNFKDAISVYYKALDIKKEPRIYNNLGSALWEAGELQKALESFNSAIDVSPESIEPHHNLGALLMKMKRFEEARQHLDKTLQLDEHHSEAYVDLGTLYELQGDYKNAEINLQKALHHSPRSASAYFQLGRIYTAQGHFGNGIASYLKVIEIDPNADEAYNHIGVIYGEKLHNEVKALEYYSKALLINSKNDNAHYNIATIFRRHRDKYPDALNHYTEAININSKNYNYFHFRGHLYEDMKEPLSAIKDFCKALELCSDPEERKEIEGHLREKGVSSCNFI